VSNPTELAALIWETFHHPGTWCDLSEGDEDEPPTGHRARPREWLLDGNQDPRGGDATGLNASLERVLGQPVHVEVVLSNAQDFVGGYLTAAQARELAAALLAVADAIDGSSQSALTINKWGRGVPAAVCVDCGHGFHPDSSPHMDRCWACAERDDEQSGR
jgi:hypothetical protein